MKHSRIKWIILALIITTALPIRIHSAIYRVRTDGADSGDGSNWSTQAMSNKKFTQTLLTAQPGDVFQLAEGVYYPYFDASGNSPSNDRHRTFLVRSSVTITGGFDASGNPVGNDDARAVLSGNIGAKDVKTDNVYHVVTVAGNSQGTSLKALSVIDGYGNGNNDDSRGAGIFFDERSGTLTEPAVLSFVRVANNQSNGDGCGIFIGQRADVKIENSIIDNNTHFGVASVWGGGISIWNYARVNVYDCVISNNSARHGGGVHVLRATYNSHHSKYINNTSTNHGGALDVYLESTVNFNADSILNNHSSLGGGIHNEASTHIIALNTVFKGNTAETGGGFYNQGDCLAIYDDCVFEENEATERGGGIENRGKMEINRSRIIHNRLTSGIVAWGGGINQNGGDLIMRQSEISNNTARHGGGFHMENGKATVSNTTISGNTATAEGGAIDCYIGTLQLIYATITNNSAPSGNGSGIYVVARPTLQNAIVSGNANEDNVRGALNDSGTGKSSTNIIGAHFYPTGNTKGTSVSFTASAHLGPLAFNRSAGTRTHALLWQYHSLENPATGQAAYIGPAEDPTYAKDQTNKNRGVRPSLGAYEEDVFAAYDDVVHVEINTPGIIDVRLNDAIPETCTPTYTLLPGMTTLQYGQFGSLNGTSVTYTPNTGARGTDTLYYQVQCGAQTEIARIIAIIAASDRPGNIKDEAICMQDMSPINFGVKEKFKNTAVRLDGFSMPLVGDLNGDKKPEIVALGLGRTGLYTDGDGLSARAWYAHIFDGQTGERIHSVNFGTEPSSNPLSQVTSLDHSGITSNHDESDDQFQLRFGPRHNSPSHLAIADLENDSIGEIVVAECGNLGRVYALKPTLDGNKKIIGFTKMWDGKKDAANHSFKAPLNSNHEVFGSPMPYISDLNGDGVPEVIVYNKIFNGKTGQLLLELETLKQFDRPTSQSNVNTCTNNKNANGGGYAYVGRRPSTPDDDDCIPAMTIIDIDNDGIMEIVAGSKIYKPSISFHANSTSGNSFTIIHGPESVSYPEADGSGTRTVYLSDGYTSVADIDGDGKLDVIVQTTSSNDYTDYKPVIYVWDPTQPSTVKAVVAFRARSTSGTLSMPFVGDINGRDDDFTGSKKLPEICFNTGIIYDNNNHGSPLAYHPLSAAYITANKAFNGTKGLGSGNNEIRGHIIGFTYHANADGSTPVHERLKLSWVMEHGDESAHTGITMFDFDADDVNELVYRDEVSLRVISPAKKIYVSKNEPVDAQNGVIRFMKTEIRSYTGFEAPVIADINGDGSADILTLAHTESSNSSSYGHLYAFEASGESWAPARPVWNQGMYYSLQINDDLTVPRRPISTLTTFASLRPGRVITDSIQPYNVNWVQQPVVRENNYSPVVFIPDLSLENLVITGVKSNPDSVIVCLTIENRGAASANTNTPITFHMTLPGSTNKLNVYTVTLNVDIYPGERRDIVFTIPGAEAGKILHARLLDDGSSIFPAAGFIDCDPTNNARQTYFVKATDDYFVITDKQVTTFEIRLNDTATCLLLPDIIESPRYGYAEINEDSLLTYVTLADNGIKDTLRYLIKCEQDGTSVTDTAYVYFIINNQPDNISDVDCYSTPPTATWSIHETTLNENVLIHNYGPLTVGDIDNDETVEIIGYKEMQNNHSTNNYESSGLKIFYFDNETNQVKLKKEFLFSASSGASSATLGAMAIARYDNKGFIVVAGTDNHLYAYTVDGGRHWKSDAPYHTNTHGTILGIADFNNDGIPEVYTGNQIFSLKTGKKLCDGGTGGSSGILEVSTGHLSAVADIDKDGTLEIIAGRNIYKVNIANHDGTAGNSIDTIPLLGWQLTAALPANATKDGATQVVDIDNDGEPEVIVTSLSSGGRCVVYVWKPLPDNQSYLLGSYAVPATNITHYSIPMIGNVDDTDYPEIVWITNGDRYYMYALKYDPATVGTNKISLKWELSHTDVSGCTGATLFDFNQDGRNEIVYRDEARLRIIDGSGASAVVKEHFDDVESGTLREFPVIADVDHDGQAEIIVTGWNGHTANGGNYQTGFIRVFKSYGAPWAPARTVWNQYGYNAVHVNEDLTIPRYPASPAIALPGDDGILGTGDDVRPYNSCMQQQTLLNNHGTPLWIAPDALLDPSTSLSVVDDTMRLTIRISNQGDASIGMPVYVTFYKDAIATANIIATDSANTRIYPGESQSITVRMPDISNYPAPAYTNFIARINDRDGHFPYVPECETDNSVIPFINPLISHLMKKEASLNATQNNGLYGNPVSVLFNENISYVITAVNVNTQTGSVIIRDTLPAYLNYVTGTASPNSGFSYLRTTGETPDRDVLTWALSSVSPMANRTVSYQATPEEGACASQPLFINCAWITTSDTLLFTTGSTFHQGAGNALVSFSTGYGGSIYPAEPQAIDYKTSANKGVLAVPDKGYIFSGWSHDDYISLRGETIKANRGIVHYDTLTIYGNVELTAHFEPEKYPILYYLNDGENAAENPAVYTIESGAITLEAPRKTGDVFIGWTGSNGDEPQKTVTIPEKSTGELEFYANFLYSGREITRENDSPKNELWASEGELYIRTTTTANVARIYSMEGVLRRQLVIVSDGVTNIKLQKGIYIVTLNNRPGQKIIIE